MGFSSWLGLNHNSVGWNLSVKCSYGVKVQVMRSKITVSALQTSVQTTRYPVLTGGEKRLHNFGVFCFPAAQLAVCPIAHYTLWPQKCKMRLTKKYLFVWFTRWELRAPEVWIFCISFSPHCYSEGCVQKCPAHCPRSLSHLMTPTNLDQTGMIVQPFSCGR